MATSSTIFAAGGVSVSTTGGLTGQLLRLINGTLDLGAEAVTVPGGTFNPALPSAPTQTALPNVLLVPQTDTGAVSIPGGYQYAVYAGTGVLAGGDPGTVIVGAGIDYTGDAASVIGTGGTEYVADTTAGAGFSFYTGAYTLTAAGGGDAFNVDTGAVGVAYISGDNDRLYLGTPSNLASGGATVSAGTNVVNITGTGEAASVSAGQQLIFLTGSASIGQSGGSSTVVTGHGGVVTLTATGGSQLVFDNAGGNVIESGPDTEFVGAAGATNTVIGAAGGADTVFAVSSIDYDGSGSASTLFLGGSGPATVIAGESATLFGGAGGGIYTEGSGSFFFWGAGDTSDTILGGPDSANVTLWGNNGENTTVSQLGAASGGVFIAFGQADTINAMNARGGNAFVIVDQSLPSGASFSGDSTLIGSNAGGDTFAFFAGSTTAPHTITIENWQATDRMFMGGFGTAESQTVSTELANGGGGDLTITLSDDTTIHFVGASPLGHS